MPKASANYNTATKAATAQLQAELPNTNKQQLRGYGHEQKREKKRDNLRQIHLIIKGPELKENTGLTGLGNITVKRGLKKRLMI